MAEKKVYYWLKLQKSFFSSLEIKTILKQQKGSEYVIFWQKLMLEVIDKIDSGIIRYKESIPYTPDVLSTLTDTDVDTVKGALNLFVRMKMIEIMENGDLIIDEVIQELVGRISDEGIRKRKYRKKIDEIKKLGLCPEPSPNVPTILEIEKEKEKDTEIETKQKKRFIPPSLEEVIQYVHYNGYDVDPQKFFNYYNEGGWKDREGNPVKNWKQKIITWSGRNGGRPVKPVTDDPAATERTDQEIIDYYSRFEDSFIEEKFDTLMQLSEREKNILRKHRGLRLCR